MVETMMMTTKEEALARRRTQNREAQRRFRWKQSQHKEKVLAAESRSDQQLITTIDAEASVEMPVGDFTLPAPDNDYATDGCFITSDLRLFGNYTLLDSFNMQGCVASDEVLQTVNGKDTRTRSSTIMKRNKAQHTPPNEGVLEAPSVKPEGWMSSLHIAAQNGNDRIVRMLLQHQSDNNERDSDGLTPLYYATVGGHEKVVTSLLERGAQVSGTDNEGRTMLHLAVIHRHDGVLKALLRHCAESQSPIDGYDDTGRTPLHVAVDTDFEAGVSLLLKHGADLNSKARKHL